MGVDSGMPDFRGKDVILSIFYFLKIVILGVLEDF